MLWSIMCCERLAWRRWRVDCVDKLIVTEPSEGERLLVRQSQHVLAAPTYLAIGALTGGQSALYPLRSSVLDRLGRFLIKCCLLIFLPGLSHPHHPHFSLIS